MRNIFLTLVFLLPLSVPSFAQNVSISRQDKAIIIRSILNRSNLPNRGLSIGEKADELNLSLENIEPSLLPRSKGMTFILFNRQQISERIKTGFLYYEFGRFKIRGKRIHVSFGYYFENHAGQTGYSGGLVYEFKKVGKRWLGTEINGFGSIS